MSGAASAPGTMIVNIDELMADFGRMHVQVTQTQKQVNFANQQIHQLTAANKQLTEDLQKQVEENKILSATNLTLIQENENILAGRPPLEPLPNTNLRVLPSQADLDAKAAEQTATEQTASDLPAPWGKRKRPDRPSEPQPA